MWRKFGRIMLNRSGPRAIWQELRRDEKGATALEFALVAVPFLSLLYGIIGVGLFFFTTFSLENAIEQAARTLRTGQAQSAAAAGNQTQSQAADAFKAAVCSYVPSFVDCAGKLRVNVLNFPSSAAITPASIPQCLTGGSLSATSSFSPGEASVVVLVWLCYEWEMTKIIPFLDLSNMGNGSRLIQASTTFRTEPYK